MKNTTLIQIFILNSLLSFIFLSCIENYLNQFHPLFQAVLKEDVDQVKALMNKDNVNNKDQFGRTLLIHSIYTENREIIKLLLKNGADVNLSSTEYLPLELTIKYGMTDITKMLINNGADVNLKGYDGGAPLHWVVYQDSTEILKLLLMHGADVNIKNDFGLTPLHVFSYNNSIKYIKLLIEHGADLNANSNSQYYPNGTPLHAASGNDALEAIQYLLSKGVDINAISKSDGGTPLHHASRIGETKTVQYLIDNGAEIEYKNNSGETPFLTALNMNNTNIANLLIKLGANYHLKSNDGRTTLHSTSHNGNDELTLFLLQKGLDINAQDQNKRTPLLYACCGYDFTGNRILTMIMLIQHGADVNHADMEGITPLMVASTHGDENMIQLLIDSKANIHARDEDGKTALHYVAYNPYYYYQSGMIKLFTQNGSDINAKITKGKDRGKTPLDLFKENGHIKSVQLLKKLGAKYGQDIL